MIKFISYAAVKEGRFLVRCNCDGLLLGTTPGVSITCEFCGRAITPEIVGDTESVNVQDQESGEWEHITFRDTPEHDPLTLSKSGTKQDMFEIHTGGK